MLRLSGKLGWTANYFRNIRCPARSLRKSAPEKLSPMLQSSSKLEKCISKENEAPTWVSSLYYVNSQLERLNIFEGDSSQRKTRERLVRLAQELHSEWHRAQGILSEQVRNKRLAFICFEARQNVLGPLSKCLQTPSQAHTSASRYPSFKFNLVLEDSEIMEDGTPRVSLSSEESLRTSISGDWGITFFSLEDLVVFLDLYHHVESEDGQLLCQLLAEVSRFLFGNMTTPLMQTASAPSMLVRLPFPQLLFAMSELGLAEERMLQAILYSRRRNEETLTRQCNNSKEKGLLYASLPLYTIRDLLLLMVALYRFGLQQDYAFERTLKTVQAQMRDSSFPIAAFQRHVEKTKKHFLSRTLTESQNTAASLKDLGHETFDPWLTIFPPLGGDFHCSPRLLVEVVTALAMSVFRSRDVLALIGNLLAANAHRELRAVLHGHFTNPLERKSMLLAISHQIHRAVHLFEEMNELQPLLAELLAWSCTISEVRVLIEGGENAAISSERRAYYDHVTADLIKVHRV